MRTFVSVPLIGYGREARCQLPRAAGRYVICVRISAPIGVLSLVQSPTRIRGPASLTAYYSRGVRVRVDPGATSAASQLCVSEAVAASLVPEASRISVRPRHECLLADELSFPNLTLPRVASPATS